MRFGIFDNHGARNSAPVFQAFRQAATRLGFQHASHDLDADVAVIWSVVWAGRMRPNQAVWQHYRDRGRPVIVLEVGTLRRGVTWKLMVNGTGQNAYWGQDIDHARPSHLGINLHDWQEPGQDIVVCAQRTDSQQWHGQSDIATWLSTIKNSVRTCSDRRLLLRAHPRQKIPVMEGFTVVPTVPVRGTYDDYDFDRVLSKAWAVINHNSGPGIQAALKGVPVFVDCSSLAAPVGNLDLAHIESPVMPDRQQWLMSVCHTEWTLDELASGWPVQRLLPGLQAG